MGDQPPLLQLILRRRSLSSKLFVLDVLAAEPRLNGCMAKEAIGSPCIVY
jgi:hypothetical protein